MNADTRPGLRDAHSPTEGQDSRLSITESLSQRGLVFVQRYKQNLDVLGDLLTGEGHNPDRVDATIKEHLNEFLLASREAQIEISNRDGRVIDNKLKGIFIPNISLLTELLRESDQTPDTDTVTEEIQTWRYLFTQSSRRDRYALTLDLAQEITTVLMKNFPGYVQSLRQFLTDTGEKSKEEIDREIKELEAKFAHASPKGKVGMAKTLRERLTTGLTSRFSTLLQIYTRIRETTQTIIPPNTYRESYDQQTDPRRKREVVEELEGIINDLLDKRSRRSRRALGRHIQVVE